MTTTNTDIKYNNNRLDGLLAGDIVTFLLIHTKYYRNPTNTHIQTTLTETVSVSASIIEIKKNNNNIINPQLPIINPGNTKSNTNKVVTTIQFKLSVDHNYKFAFYEFDKFYIEIFDGVQIPIVKKYVLIVEYVLDIDITQLNKPTNKKLNNNISPIVNYLSEIITKTENANNIIIKRINKLKYVQSLYHVINTELNKPGETDNNVWAISLKSDLNKLEPEFNKPEFNEPEFNNLKYLYNVITNLIKRVENDNHDFKNSDWANDLKSDLKKLDPKLNRLEKEMKDVLEKEMKYVLREKLKDVLVKRENLDDNIKEIGGKRLTNKKKTIKNLKNKPNT